MTIGFSSEAIRHIVMTHLHFDHAGGLPDFPHAQVHVHRREYEAVQHPRTWIELAYDGSDFAHEPAWVLYEQTDAEWLGLEAIRQVNTALAQSCQPFVAWRLEWVSGETDRLWPDGVPQIRNEHGSAYVTSYAHDEAGNLVYLGMVGDKTVLESIRATV